MDPNNIIAPPVDTWVWIAPDWSADSATQKPGYTRVKVRETRYADGRIVRNVLDTDGNPVAADGTPAPTPEAARPLDAAPVYDKEQERRFKDQATTAQRQQAQGPSEGDTRGPQTGAEREVYRSGAWTVEPNPLYKPDAPAAGAQAAAPGGKPFVDDGADAGAQGRRWGWNPETRLYDRDLGPSPSAQKPAATTTDPVGKPTGNTRQKEEGGQAIKETEYVLPDGTKEWRTQTAPAEGSKPGAVDRKFTEINGRRYETRTTPGKPGEVPKVEYFDDAGAAIPTLPTATAGVKVQKRDKAGNVYFEVSTEKGGQKELTYENEKGEKIPPPSDSAMAGVKGVPTFVPDLMKPGGGLYARQKQLDELMAAGTITWEQRQAILESDGAMARGVASDFNAAATILREQYQQDVSQRSSDMTQANTRANLADSHHKSAIGLIEKFAPYLGATAGDAGKLFVGMMASQLATATMYGGMKDSPRVEMDPRLRQFADRKLDAALGTATPPGPGQLPANAIGAGAVPAAITPTGAPPSLAAEMQAAPIDPAQIRADHAASGQPLPAPLLAPAPMVAAPPTPAVTQTDPLAMAPAGDPSAMEAMYGKVLPQATSWREEAENRLYALEMPQVPGIALPGIGTSLPEQYTQPGGMDYSLPMPTAEPYSFGGDIDAEARRQLLEAGVIV